MDATTTKDLLHLRIEQADEKMLNVLSKVVESLFEAYQPEVLDGQPFVAERQGGSGENDGLRSFIEADE